MLFSQSDREPIEQLAEQFAHEQRSGANPSIEDYVRQYPEHADEIRDLFPALLVMEELSPGETRNKDIDATQIGSPPPKSLGDYEIVREVGRGGMGVVYEARQQSLSRRVALKVLPFHAVENAELRWRFQREARAAARLDHPHIVPVYEVGEHDGCPYFSMRFVDGTTLLDRLADGPIEEQQAVAWLLPITQAIALAHREGVLHRDLKPSNILLNTEEQPLIADFGLAKTFQPGAAASYTQAMIGTPSYMAPEQASDSGGQVAATTDVYGLGAVLYHMLTGRPPFQAATAVDTLRQVTQQEPVGPRQLNAAISRDLETICLKCLAKEPSRRYATAMALAEDLQRYQEGKPILARRLSGVARGLRWCRRHPMRAAALGMLLVTCAVIAGAYVMTAGALQESEQSHQQTREVVDYYLRRVSEDPRFDQHGLQPLRQDLLQAALEHYERFVQQRGDDPALSAEIADAHFHLGLIKEHIDTLPAALESFGQAERRQRVLADGEAPEHMASLSKTLAAMGRIRFRQGKWPDAHTHYEECLALRKQLVSADDAPEYKRLLANAHMNLGLVDKEAGQLEAARLQFHRAQKLRRELLESKPGDTLVRRDLGKGLVNDVGLMLQQSKTKSAELSKEQRTQVLTDAEAALQEAINLFEELAREEPDNPDHQLRLAICWRTLADVKTAEDSEAAQRWYRQAVPQLEDLSLANPQMLDYQVVLAGAYLNLAQAEFRAGHAEVALDRFHYARRAYRILIRAQGKHADGHAFHLALCERSIGELEAIRKNFHVAIEYLTLARGRFEELVAEFPDQEEYEKHHRACDAALETIERILAQQHIPDGD